MISRLSPLSKLRSFLRHPHVTRGEIIAFQNKQLRRLISYAYENVPYYQKLFDRNNIKPNDIQTVSDLSIIPITSKNDLQSLHVEEVVSHRMHPNHLIVRRTSGFSGEPFTIRRTWLEERLLGALRLRASHYFGLRANDRTASIVRVRPTDPRDIQLPLRLLQALGLYHKLQIDCLLPPQDILHALRHFHPDVLTGFSGVISHLAQIMNDNDRQVIRPRFVVVGAEVLTPLMRHQIAEVFETPVFETYGSHEFNLIASECKETGEFHTCDDGMIVEVNKDGGTAAMGERGEVVGTNLHSYAMLFIRYRLGDIVTKGLETCRCGQPFSTIRAVQGRMLDYFPLPGGRVMHPYEITSTLVCKTGLWIRQYQLTQEREDRIILQVVPSTTPTPQELIQLKESAIAVLGQDVEFQVILVPEIELEPNGKFRVSRSLLKSAYNGIEWQHL